ncbi:hypothetical protein ACQP1G_13875 [Nocardia sp. CA-107356]|uniref:hypothetical protein n=1 Tax=Nocardia sp. CA-107356 TaxID=3239972 RepID=UPI003D8F243D
MSAPEMVLQYINALKWPVVVVLAITLFRTPARAMLAQVQRLRVAAFGAEAEMERQAQDFARDVSAVPADTPPPLVESLELDSQTSGIPNSEPPDAQTAGPQRSRIIQVAPQVAAVGRIPAAEFLEFQASLSALKDFSYSGSSVLRTIESEPAETMIRIAHDLKRIVGSIGGGELWPGTPYSLESTWTELLRLRNRAAMDGASVAAAHSYNVGARDWARRYTEFLEAAVEAFEQIPRSASVDMIADASTDALT